MISRVIIQLGFVFGGSLEETDALIIVVQSEASDHECTVRDGDLL